MATDAIRPDDLPEWVPGELTVSSNDVGWRNLGLRGYRYAGSDVEVPPLRDLLIVAYPNGGTTIRRQVEHEWSTETLRTGDVSVMSNAVHSHWTWPDDVEVIHVYLSPEELRATCEQMYEREVEQARLRDVLRAEDPAIHQAVSMLGQEIAHPGAGSPLLIESITTQLSVHLLRRYADVLFRETSDHEGLTLTQERTVREFIREHLGEKISLDDLCATVSLSRFHFARRFRQSTGFSPYEFVIRKRVELAKTLLSRTDTELVDVVSRCGFADQSHLTRVFKKHVGVTPGRFRAGL